MRRPSRAPNTGNTQNQGAPERSSTAATLDEQEDLEKIMSLQYTINFDVVFVYDYTNR